MKSRVLVKRDSTYRYFALDNHGILWKVNDRQKVTVLSRFGNKEWENHPYISSLELIRLSWSEISKQEACKRFPSLFYES